MVSSTFNNSVLNVCTGELDIGVQAALQKQRVGQGKKS